ncbi:MAG: ABC transporter substrate-binding protein, partial [Enterobacterales bacterium]|nr:ABC transporter substrate-binding protein [Enterobacterales bacterium]
MHLFRITALSALIASGFVSAQAAQVPAGTVLAEKQEIVRHIKDEPASLDPAKVVGLPEAQVARDLFEGLVNQGADGKPTPGVAQSWQTTDNKRYVFKLRENAKWSNGDPVTAYDFVYSWQRLVNPKTLSPFAWFAQMAGIANAEGIINGQVPVQKLGVAAPDSHTLVVQLNKPVPFFVNLLANFSLFPVPQKTIERYGNDWTKPENLVGNGAYAMQERVVNEK